MKFPVVICVSLTMIACTPGSQQPSSSEQRSTAPAATDSLTVSDLTSRLRSAGVNVEPAGEIEQPFFTRRALVFRVDDEDVQVYEFATGDAAARAAEEVAPGGGSIGTTMMSWMAPPHFYRKDRLIVVHIGTNAAVARALAQAMGQQFAGL